MDEGYYPPSDFLCSILAENVELGLEGFLGQNLERLLAMVGDSDTANRDWATMLIAHLEWDTPEIRDALCVAAQDDAPIVRAEAILGLANRDRNTARALALAQFQPDADILPPLLDAIATLADPIFIPLLETVEHDPADSYYVDCLRDALAACERGMKASHPIR